MHFQYEKQSNTIKVPFHFGSLRIVKYSFTDVCKQCKQVELIQWRCMRKNCKDSNCSGNYVLCGQCKDQHANQKIKISGNKRKLVKINDDTDNVHLDTTCEPSNKEAKIIIILYCLCEQPFDTGMIGCDYCDDGWYHPQCLDMGKDEEKEARESNKWHCPQCDSNVNH
eukprot:249669_1